MKLYGWMTAAKTGPLPRGPVGGPCHRHTTIAAAYDCDEGRINTPRVSGLAASEDGGATWRWANDIELAHALDARPQMP